MASPRDLLKVQIGTESSWGTPVAPTAELPLVTDITLSPNVTSTVHEDMRGSLAPGQVATLDQISGEGSMTVVAAYETLPYLLDNAFSQATPSGGGPYVYTYAAPTTAVSTPRKLTVVHGEGSNVYGLTGAVANDLTINFESNAPWTVDTTFTGEQVLTDTFASLTTLTATPIMGNDTTLYIDAWGGTIGTTAVTASFFSGSLSIQPGRAPVFALGSKTPTQYVENRYQGTLSLTLEVTSQTKAFVDNLIGGALTQHQIRIKATIGANEIVELDFAGTLTTSPEIFTDTDGVVTYELEWSGTHNTALGNWFEASVTNQIATLA